MIVERMQRERETIVSMIEMYCWDEHKQTELCESCAELKEYALFRLSKCPFQEKKPACQNCKIHCYKPDMKGQVKEVMRKSGPKMIWKHPYFAIMHMADTFRKAPDLPRRTKRKA